MYPCLSVNTIALAKPEKAKMVENMLIQMAQTGQIQGKVSLVKPVIYGHFWTASCLVRPLYEANLLCNSTDFMFILSLISKATCLLQPIFVENFSGRSKQVVLCRKLSHVKIKVGHVPGVHVYYICILNMELDLDKYYGYYIREQCSFSVG